MCESSKVYKCGICGKKFLFREHLDEHIDDHLRWAMTVKESSKFHVYCRDYVDGVRYLLNKYDEHRDPVDDWREYRNDYGIVVVVMNPIGDLWTFEIEKVLDTYSIRLIGYSQLLRRLDKNDE
jgi:hypothetical protein